MLGPDNLDIYLVMPTEKRDRYVLISAIYSDSIILILFLLVNSKFWKTSPAGIQDSYHLSLCFCVCSRAQIGRKQIICDGVQYLFIIWLVCKNSRSDISFVVSVRPHGTTRLPLDGFSWNFIYVDFSTICLQNSILYKSDKNKAYFTWRPT